MLETIIAIIISIPIGIACSIIAWWILFHKVVPQISFSDGISKTRLQDSDPGFCYRIKFENTGRRDIIDIQIHAYLRIVGLRSGKASGIKTSIEIFTSKEYVPKMRKNGKGFIVRLYPERTESFERRAYPEHIKLKYREKSLTLEDIFSLGYEAKLKVIVLGYDSFSGARRIFESKLYGIDDIKEGHFKGLQIYAEKTA
jgi:hypothetical protein